MLETLAAAIIAFVSTNIDDLVINMLLFAGADTGRKVRAVVAGKYLGIGVLVAVSLLGACGLQFVSTQHLGLLGLLPIALGVKEWFAMRRGTDDDEAAPSDAVGALSVMTVTLANGADNLGVYIPLFSGYGVTQMVLTVGVFALLTGLWCLVGRKLSALPALQRQLTRYKRFLVPVVFVALGIYIILKS